MLFPAFTTSYCKLSSPDKTAWKSINFTTLSLENHQDGVYLHRHGVTLSLQAILVCSNLPAYFHRDLVCHLTSYAIIACPTLWPYILRSFVRSRLTLTCSIKPGPCVITRKLCGCDDTHQDIFFFWGCSQCNPHWMTRCDLEYQIKVYLSLNNTNCCFLRAFCLKVMYSVDVVA